ncbi:hypothetical protein HB779_16815 [Phyllobacterium sp. 628]|uniref:hypothetical protein n=1 Tax=Phyllobacterium sp. 628 TaxID=2718938 RepID=UPI0016625EF4|nr:hypothetical protein [Phyllobacterium sp. 628]QND53360.1 hypothetical protein HB779_16815 [Phyllobacterium sp. 628]
MKRSMTLVITSLLLSSCLPNPPPKIVTDPHLGVSIAYGSFANVAVDTSYQLFIPPFNSSHDEYGFSTLLDRRGKASLSEAWSFGKKLHYEKGEVHTMRCSDRGNCPTLESGIVMLDESDFQTGAKSGFEFELIGKGGRAIGKIAPESFREVLALKGKLVPVATSQAKVTKPLPQ